MAWLTGWKKRVKLTIDSGDIDAALTDFPILIFLSTSSGRNNDDVSFVFDELTLDANRKKIAVTKTDGVTECYVEIEEWDDGSEEAWLWAKVSGASSIASGSDTDLYLYFDSSHADNTTYVGDTNDVVAESVWDANFLAVYHMRDGASTSAIYDSTDSDYDGAKTAANEPIVNTSGRVSDCQFFDATNDDIDLGDIDILRAAAEGTVEVYYNTANVAGGFMNMVNEWEQFYVGVNDNKYIAILFDETNGRVNFYPADAIANGAWHQYVFTFDGGTQVADMYVDGASVEHFAATGVTQLETDVGGNNCYIGAWTGGAEYWDDYLDEIRISDIDRPAAWIKATHQSCIDDLLDFGTEENYLPRPAGMASGTTLVF